MGCEISFSSQNLAFLPYKRWLTEAHVLPCCGQQNRHEIENYVFGLWDKGTLSKPSHDRQRDWLDNSRFRSGDIIGVLCDMDKRTISFYRYFAVGPCWWWLCCYKTIPFCNSTPLIVIFLILRTPIVSRWSSCLRWLCSCGYRCSSTLHIYSCITCCLVIYSTPHTLSPILYITRGSGIGMPVGSALGSAMTCFSSREKHDSRLNARSVESTVFCSVVKSCSKDKPSTSPES